MKIGYRTDLDEQRILGLIDDDTYYMLKRHEAALTYDVEEQQRLMRLQLLEKRQKQKKQPMLPPNRNLSPNSFLFKKLIFPKKRLNPFLKRLRPKAYFVVSVCLKPQRLSSQVRFG